MRDLSLHLLDLLENSLAAGALRIELLLELDPTADLLRLELEDDGPGLPVEPSEAVDPFFTTKRGKRTGLGLPLFGASVEQADGSLLLEPSALGGLAIRATMRCSHVDRLPLGDVPATLATVVCSHPQVDLRFTLRCAGRQPGQLELSVDEERRALAPPGGSELLLAGRVAERLRSNLEQLGFSDL